MIRLEGVSKDFPLHASGFERLLRLFREPSPGQVFSALSGVSFAIQRGESVGIVGRNGAGKSTLLKIISGITSPTRGLVEADGRISALIELGTGFHGELSGRKNIYVNGQLLGYSREQLEGLEEEIIAFSELGDFIDSPLRTYSSGMTLRLGFSIAVAVRPMILIVDEALSVGDARFSAKCVQRIRQLQEEGTTLLFVSHDPQAILTLCNRAILLERGRLMMDAAPKAVLEEYHTLLAGLGEGNAIMQRLASTTQAKRYGSLRSAILSLEMTDGEGTPTRTFMTGEVMLLRLLIWRENPSVAPSAGMMIRDRLGNDVFGTRIDLLDYRLDGESDSHLINIVYTISLNLAYGDYHLTVALHEGENQYEQCHDWIDHAADFSVRTTGKETWAGMVRLPAEAKVEKANWMKQQADFSHALAEGVGPHVVFFPLVSAEKQENGWKFRQKECSLAVPRRFLDRLVIECESDEVRLMIDGAAGSLRREGNCFRINDVPPGGPLALLEIDGGKDAKTIRVYRGEEA